jgi:DNA helicase-2/ATP-dependent DNA helicase PcrA
MVDEFQDTNYLQYSIVKKFVNYEGSPRNVCAVGDDAQSIYAFRGATIQNILDYEQDFKNFGIKIFKLEQNYRSTEHIVKAANEVISYNTKQIQKTIFSDKGDGQKIRVIKAMTDTEEGKRVASQIVEQKNRHHLANKDIAILYRTNSQSRVFEEWLRNYNIKYRVFGGLSFYQRKEVKDLVAYMRLTINQRDEEALRRVINYPRRGIGNTTIQKISATAEQLGLTMWETLFKIELPARTKNNIGKFIRMIQEFMKKAKESDAYVTGMFIAKQSGIMDDLGKDKTVEGMNRVENIRSLLDGIQTFVDNDVVETGDGGRETADGMEDEFTQGPTDQFDRSLSSYLQNIALMTDLDEADEEADFVTLMSVHAAKGLEYKSVFVTGMEEQLFPSFMSMDTPEGLDEERRLFYVAITRAEQHLTLSFANSRYRFGQQRFNSPSRFLDEIDVRHLDMAMPIRGKSKDSFGTGRIGSSNISNKRQTSGVSGNFKRTSARPKVVVDPSKFKASPSSQIQQGMKVLHMKFGQGVVTSVDGTRDKRIATIFFDGLETEKEKRIMLRFAKLQIVE